MDLTPGLRRDAPPDMESIGEDEALVARIRSEIEHDGPITFARFMELALYDPAGGYYRAEAGRPGRGGDFLTAPETHPIFGAALARGLEEVWQRLGNPEPFVLREYGAGTGSLALAILEQLEHDQSGLARAMRYDPIEIEAGRLETIAGRFAATGRAGLLVSPASSGQLAVGVVLGNEVLDALPTHRVVARNGALRELLVDWVDGRFTYREADPTRTALAGRLAAEEIALADGQRAEICLALEPWMAAAAAGLERGMLLLIDYGYGAVELYDPIRRREGTLRAYLRHRVHDDPFRHVGRQDLTAHIDVTAVERSAAAAGLTHLGTISQAEFLVGLGTQELLQAIQTDPRTKLEDYLVLRSGLMRLLDPAAMGRFRVMGFGRGWPDGPELAGFAYRLGSR